MENEITLEGFMDCDTHEWCSDKLCPCLGAVCELCFAVRNLSGESE